MQEFVSIMGIPEEWIGEFVLLNPVWMNDALCCKLSSGAEATPMTKRVSDAMLAVFRWRTCVDTRRIATDGACRALCASLTVGLEALIAVARGLPRGNHEHLDGCARINGTIKHD